MTESPERVAVRNALDGLKPFLEAFLGQRPTRDVRRGPPDISALLKEVLNDWDRLGAQLPSVARSYVHELLDARNRWAHEQAFSSVEADRAIDTARQLARVIGAPDPVRHGAAAGAAPLRPNGTSAALKWSGQRETMREIFRRVNENEDRAIAEYAAAERAGLVLRKGNKSGHTPEDYAKALLADGLRKGWLS